MQAPQLRQSDNTLGGMMLEDLDYDEASSRNSFGSTMRNHPLYTAIHFDRRFCALVKHAINGPAAPLGKVVDYFYRVKFQNRGSAHYHMFFGLMAYHRKYQLIHMRRFCRT